MSPYSQLQAELRANPKTWLVTGVAGFIGSNLLETLLKLEQSVAGLDNFATGKKHNLAEVQQLVTTEQWKRFRFIDGDIQDLSKCQLACRGVDYVLHQAALGSVPRSIEDPVRTHATNLSGFLNMLIAARDSGLKRFVYASSSSVYGDDPNLPKQENRIGKPLSPYAVTKLANEHYANVFARCYGMETIGLRYFNIFGPRQDPAGPYAAVIPKWIFTILGGEPVEIYGDGETSRDFCYIENAVQANLLAATTTNPEAINQIYNIAVNQRTTLNELYGLLSDLLTSALCSLSSARRPPSSVSAPIYRPFRPGDVRHSQADITHAQKFLGYEPTHTLAQGLMAALEWYKANAHHGTSRVAGRVEGRMARVEG